MQDRRRLDLVAARLGEALCCDATLVAPLRRDGRPQPRVPEEDGAAMCGLIDCFARLWALRAPLGTPRASGRPPRGQVSAKQFPQVAVGAIAP